MLAVRTVVSGLFSLLESLVQLKEGVADLASKLTPFNPIIVVEIGMGCITTGTDHLFRHTGRVRVALYGR